MPTSKSRVRVTNGSAALKCRARWLARRGMAIPLIVCFIVFMGIFLGSMVYNRINIKRQTKTTFEYLAAHYMAQSALQHMYLKLRLLPNEAYDTSSVALGLCPFDRSGTVGSVGVKSVEPMKVMTGDVCTVADVDGEFPSLTNSRRGYPLNDGTSDDLKAFDDDGWGYRMVAANAVTAHTKDKKRILVIELEAEGFAESFVIDSDGSHSSKERVERIKKTIEITRQHGSF